jgi:hypothetical protein
VDGRVLSSDLVRAHHVTRHNTPIHNILSTAAQLSICQKSLGNIPEDGNVMPNHVGAEWIIGVFVGFPHLFILGILIFKGLTARRLYKSFGVKGLNNSPPTEWIFMSYNISGLTEHQSRKLKFDNNNNGTVHEDVYTVTIISRSFLRGVRNFQTKFVDRIKTHALCSRNSFPGNRDVYEIMWKKYGTAGEVTDGNIMLCRKDALCMLGN